MFERLDAAALGKLVALYEHKVYVQGVVWDGQLVRSVGRAARQEARFGACARGQRRSGATLLPQSQEHSLRCALTRGLIDRRVRRSRACALSLLGYADIMRAFRRGSLSNVGTNRVSVAHNVVCTRVFAAIEMTSLPRGVLQRAARGVAGMALVVMAATALAQVPIPVDEQIRLFNSMSPAQQQSLIRELQRSLPPAQREAIIGLLQGDGNAERQQG